MAKVFRIKKLVNDSVFTNEVIENALSESWPYECEGKTKDEIHDLGLGVLDEWMEEENNNKKVRVVRCSYGGYWYNRLVGRNCVFEVVGETKDEYIVDIYGAYGDDAPVFYVNKEDAEVVRQDYKPFPTGTPASELIGKAVVERHWNKDTFLITGVTRTGVWLDGGEVPFAELFYAYTFLDGKPCGIV